MHPLRTLAALALAAAFCSCQNEPTASDDTNAKGGLALAFSARAIAQMGSADSVHLRLFGERDTIQSISRLGDTVRFDGLRTGTWLVDAQVYANDSGIRTVAWVGSASAFVEPGRTARVPLLLHKPTGSLIVEIDIDDGTIDTPIVILPHDTLPTIPPSDTPSVPNGRLPISLADSGRWFEDSGRYVTTPRFDTSASWIVGSVRLLGIRPGPFGAIARVAIRGGSNAVASILAPIQDACPGNVDTACLPYHVQLVGRTAFATASRTDTAIRIAEVLVNMSARGDRQLVMGDDYGTFLTAEASTLAGSRCDNLHDGGLVICYDAAGFNSSWYDPFDR